MSWMRHIRKGMRNRYIASSISLLIGVLIIVQSLLGNIVAGVWQGWLGDRAWVISIPFLMISALLLGYDLNTFLRERTQQEHVEPRERNRQAMLEKVRATWIVGVLDQSLYKETRITLGLHIRPDAVTRSMDVLVQRTHHADRALPLDKPISDVYDELNQAMLILGAPGAGKTTLLLELTRDLLDRATHDSTHPIPVVFPLSSWVEHRHPLADWLVDELHLRYDIPRTIALAWIDANTILPLLDGLDEVAEQHRAACVDAINTFRRDKYGLLPLVVSSRIADYDALTVKLRLDGAIVVQSLTREQIRSYLRQVGITITPSSTSPLWDLLDSPLMLNIAIMTYAQPSGAAVPIHDIHQDQLFAAYIKRMFQRNSPQLPFSQQQTMHWLSWLAWQMQQHNQTVFYLENMQPDWLPRRQRWRPTRGVGLVGALVGGLASGLIGGLSGGLIFGPGWGLIVGLVGGLVWGLIWGLLSYSKKIMSVEEVRWSWFNIRTSLQGIVLIGLVVGLVGALVGGLTSRLIFGQGGVMGGVIGGALLNVLSSGLIFGVGGALVAGELGTKTVPNQGIRRSAQNAFRYGLVFGLFGMVVGVLVGGVLGRLIIGLVGGILGGLVIGLFGGLFAGLGAALVYGGRSCLQHLVLRRLLIRNGSAPRNYVDFLDFAAQRILLRKVGGGYIFIHRLLLDYFAKQYTGPEAAEVNTTSKGT